jgi:hypothetical protein
MAFSHTHNRFVRTLELSRNENVQENKLENMKGRTPFQGVRVLKIAHFLHFQLFLYTGLRVRSSEQTIALLQMLRSN